MKRKNTILGAALVAAGGIVAGALLRAAPGEAPGFARSVAEPQAEAVEADSAFAPNAFPPTVSDMEYHQDAWMRDDCLRCHETGVQSAPMVRHEGMTELLLAAKCRSCHVLIPGQAAPAAAAAAHADESGFASFAFPPMMPVSDSHRDAWEKDDCLYCHETGSVRNAPVVKHAGMPALLLKAKCRSCHVQVRSAGL